MKRIFRIALLMMMAIVVASAKAQSGYTAVTGTINQCYATGSVQAYWVNQSSAPTLPTLNGSAFPQRVPNTINSSAQFTLSLADVAIVQPGPFQSQWNITVCAKAGSNPSCYSQMISVTGNTMDVSSFFTGAPIPQGCTMAGVASVTGGTANGLAVTATPTIGSVVVTAGPDSGHLIPVNSGSSSSLLDQAGGYTTIPTLLAAAPYDLTNGNCGDGVLHQSGLGEFTCDSGFAYAAPSQYTLGDGGDGGSLKLNNSSGSLTINFNGDAGSAEFAGAGGTVAINPNSTDSFDSANLKMVNVADGVDPADAVNVSQLTTVFTTLRLTSNVLNSIYQNTGTTNRQILASFNNAAGPGTGDTFECKIGATSPPTTIETPVSVFQAGSGATSGQMTCFVPPSNYYEIINGSTGTLMSWYEIQ